MSGKSAREGGTCSGCGSEKRAGARGAAARLVEGDGRARRTNTPETNHAMKCGAMSWRYMSHAATGKTDEHEQVYEDPDGLEHLAQHRPHRFPVLVRAEDRRRTRNATRSRGRNVSRGRTSRPPARCGGGGPDGDPCAHASRARQTAERSPSSRNVRTRATTSGVAAEKNSVSRLKG